MIDILLDEDYEIQFTEFGDFRQIDVTTDREYQDVSILLNIDTGHNKQFPSLGVAIYKSINGDERQLFSSIISNSNACNINIKNIFIDTDKKLQIVI